MASRIINPTGQPPAICYGWKIVGNFPASQCVKVGTLLDDLGALGITPEDYREPNTSQCQSIRSGESARK
jgi:hypothetical protein